MNKELRKSFNELKLVCNTTEKRKAYNKLVKTFAKKNITKDWLIDLIDTWMLKQRKEFSYDSDKFMSLAKNEGMKPIEIKLIGNLTLPNSYTTDKLINSMDDFATISDVNLYNVLKFLISLT